MKHDSKVLFISYHYHPHPGYRSSLVHNYFKLRCKTQNYLFLHADWDHHTKTQLPPSHDPSRSLIPVPAYQKNLSLQRIFSHLIFSFKVSRHSFLNQTDLLYVCVPPSAACLWPLIVMKWRRKPCIIDIVDLWPEALPIAKWKKKVFMMCGGFLWIKIRNLILARATRLVSHCTYFLAQFGGPSEKVRVLPLAQAQPEVALLCEATRKSIHEEVRILVLGSINHVLDWQSLVRLMQALVVEDSATTQRKIVLEILGVGESKNTLLEGLKNCVPSLEIIDHKANYDPIFKRGVLSRVHFGYNGYSAQTSIGITYKSIDFSSQGLVFLNSVHGDLRDLITQSSAGFNYLTGEEKSLAQQLLNLSQTDYEAMSQASRTIYNNLFQLEHFHQRMTSLLNELEPKQPLRSFSL